MVKDIDKENKYMEKEAFEPTGLIPRSIIRTGQRFVQQLLPGREKIAIQEYRVSRYQILVSIKSLLMLILIPLILNFTIKALVFTPVIEHFWNSHQAEIFLNQYQERRAFSEMHDFSEKMFFESLCTPYKPQITYKPQIKCAALSNVTLNAGSFNGASKSLQKQAQNFDKRGFGENLVLGGDHIEDLLVQDFASPQVLPKAMQSKTYKVLKNPVVVETKFSTWKNISLTGSANKKSQKFSSACQWYKTKPCTKEMDQQTVAFWKIDNVKFIAQTENKLEKAKPLNNPNPLLSLDEAYKVTQKPYNLTFDNKSPKKFQFVEQNKSLYTVEQKLNSSERCLDENVQELGLRNTAENNNDQTLFQIKSLELAKSYNKQSIVAITNLLGDFFSFFILSLLFRVMRPELIILKSFLTESVYSLSDTTKSFLLILGMDLLVGFHSPRGWELALEGFLRHIGLPENENFILLFVALFPVFLDTVFKYWIFRYLNKISPSTVVTYHSMIE